ncbi:hypothetical protein IGI04_035733 [Brassica rapa subsp. trilocularis]|uniref:Uncharacterized protein n=1 Tax=Brassica rapa subsp. trilocularis TaxID=1813537 RepID=A0ABQ7LCL9_BRACM|nr:hypothetical protein IGI04_035733 [Brassica rapa subsp. trilocularis]
MKFRFGDVSLTEPVADLAHEELEESDSEEELDETNTTIGYKELDGSSIGFNSARDPFSFSNGPITRSKTRQLKEAILGLVYTKPISTSEENQVKEALKIFNCSIFNTTYGAASHGLRSSQSSDSEEELDETNTTIGYKELDGSSIGFNSARDPFSFSNGPITRSKTRQLKEAILGLVYTKPISTSEENQVKEALKIFNCSIFNTT